MALPLGSTGSSPAAVVRALPFTGDDAALVAGLRAESPAAVAALCERYSGHVLSVLVRVLGHDPEVPDLHHDALFRAVRAARRIEDPSALRGFLSIIAVNVARSAIKRRARARWLRFLPWYELPEVETHAPADDPDAEALRCTYAILGELPADERIAFALRFVEGMELTEVAAATGTSLATVKRRLRRAEERFLALARLEPALSGWLKGGARWGRR
jgi:RNA polymerase sigma-70 factor (ECF subfamily)